MRKRLTGIFMAALMAGWVYGTDQTWNDNTGSGLWTNKANWAGNALPGPSDKASFDNTKVGTCIIDTDVTIGNYRCLSTSGTNVLQIAPGKTLTVSSSGFFYPASGTQNSNLIVSNGTLKLTGSASLYAAVGGSTVSTSSTWTAFQNVTVNFDNAKRLFVGYTTISDNGRLAEGFLDLSGATITSGTATNTIRLSGDTFDPWGLQVGRNRATGILKLPPAVTNIEAQAFYLGGYDTPDMATSWIDLGINPLLKRIKVNGGSLYNCFGDFTYSDGITTYTGLPDGVEMNLGSSTTPLIFYLGFAHYVYGSPPSTLLRRSWGGFSRFAAYFDDVLIGHAQAGAPHYSSTELDLSKATVSFNNSSAIFYVKNRLGVGQFETAGSGKSDGTLRLPSSITSITCSSFAFGGFAATNASLVQFGTNAFNTLTCSKGNFYFNNGRFRHVTPAGATNDGFSASGITLKLGLSNQRGVLEVGRCNSSASYSGEAILAGVTNVQAYLTSLTIGQNTNTSYRTTGIVDLRGASLAPLSVSGTVQLCDVGNTLASLYLSDGTATVGNVTMALNNTNSATLWLSNAVVTVSNSFTMGKSNGTACSATVTNIVAGKSSGLDLLFSNSNNFMVQNTGVIKVIFQAEPIARKDPCWGLRMEGNQTLLFSQMIADGRLTWETPGLSGGTAAQVRVYYEEGKTCLGIKPGYGTIIMIH